MSKDKKELEIEFKGRKATKFGGDESEVEHMTFYTPEEVRKLEGKDADPEEDDEGIIVVD